jgi:hypothetical protein
MALKRLAICGIFTVLLAVSAQGATVSFLVIETGLHEETPIFESSRIWENAMMGVFFDTGHIVSNSPILRLSEEEQEEEMPEDAWNAIQEAMDGGAEFFVIATLDYQHPPRVLGPDPQPRAISIRLFRTNPFSFVYAQDYSVQSKITAKDEFINAMSAAKTITARLNDK